MGRKAGIKNKNHIEYICPNCLKNYGCRKYEYNVHMNKLKPCKKKNNIQTENNEVNSNNDKEINDIFNDNNSYDNNFDDDESDDNNFDDIKAVSELTKKMDYLIKQNEELKKQNDEFKKQNEEFKEDIDKLKNQITLSTGTNKNDIKNYINVNMNIQINNFNDIDYKKMNPKTLIKTLIKEQGKQIFIKAIEDFFVNPNKPENHNVYVADKNRKYLKIYNNEKWITDNFTIIDKIIENFVNIYKLSIGEIKKDAKLYDRIKKSIQDKMKYLNYCDFEYLGELEYEQDNGDIDNKDEIKRCKEFYEMVHNDVINLLHDNKNIILSTHKNNF
jgi:hypothetical protein